MNKTNWNASLYDEKHSFVWKLASSVVELLAPKTGERILDVGCGTGQLTAQIAESGAHAIGFDNSTAMIDEACQLFPQITFQEADAHDFHCPEPFDAVFSNAALHWIIDPDRVAACVARALKPNGRLVVEFGGDGNVSHLANAIESAFEAVVGRSLQHPWYFPNIAGFSTVLESHGIEVTHAAMIDRPTRLEGDDGLRNWVRMFGNHWLGEIPSDQHNDFFEAVERFADPNLQSDGTWFADYRRIRVVGRKIS
ncbi:class I SAM-dependent methyltransferase [Rubripirellula reticaptiva]|uniref:Trans-aconitate 2-methyltransferase n=1 Tax=Rubripirellula reticaptiva TaxID=2528013 RepID=A0A5C6EPK0_9BACT|nr:class I SAM-dependent methyltransferase [Rubripirellula reticaptiva]TWU49269.1 Trans-aconitate 2-methyltransferase [Rubripirellula reticaptiva]